MFVGREKELRDLDKMYHSDKFEFAVIYGRRRVGKTALISHFIQDKKVFSNTRKEFKVDWYLTLFRQLWNMYFSWLRKRG